MRRGRNDGSGRGGRSIGGSGRRSWWVRGGIATVIGALALSAGNPALASGKRVFGDVSIFASAPAPGHPFGIAVDDARVYVSTSAGDFFAGHQNSDDERVFAYDEDGNLVRTTVIDTAQNSDMGLFGLALDGNSGQNHKLYVADMNGRILRLDTAAHPAAPQVFSQAPDFERPGRRLDEVDVERPRLRQRPATCTSPTTSRGSGGSGRTLLHRSASPDPRLDWLLRLRRCTRWVARFDPTGQWLYVSITGVRRFTRRVVDLSHPAGRPPHRHRTSSSSTSSRSTRPPPRRFRRPASRSPSPATCMSA